MVSLWSEIVLARNVLVIYEGLGLCVQTYSGKGTYAGHFIMKYQLEGDPDRAAELCSAVGCTPSVISWSLGCALQENGNAAEE